MSAFNAFRYTADLVHSFAICYLLFYLLQTKTCSGVSGKSQLLLAATFTSRYVDLLDFKFVMDKGWLQFYNPIFKIFFIISSYTVVYLIYWRLRRTYETEYDSFRSELLLLPSVALGLYINHDNTPQEVLWAMSVFLESVAMVPQFFMTYRKGQAPPHLLTYLLGIGSYRALYIANWLYRFYLEHHHDCIAIKAGLLQTATYLVFFIWYFCRASLNSNNPGREETPVKLPKEPVTLPTVVYIKGDMEPLLNVSL